MVWADMEGHVTRKGEAAMSLYKRSMHELIFLFKLISSENIAKTWSSILQQLAHINLC